MRLEIGPDLLRFYESRARVDAVRPGGDGSVTLDLAFEGEGQAWRDSRSLRLLADGRLRVADSDGPVLRVRCEDAPAAAGAPRWALASSGTSGGLFLADIEGQRLVHFQCGVRPGQLLVNVPSFRAVASEERMTFGSGGTVVTLVADFRGDAERGGVSGSGPVPDELEAILSGEAGVSVNYGSQNAGPFPAPPRSLAERFVSFCRGG